MPLTAPNPQTWTLRLKSHKTTLLLHINPTTPFAAIKQELLSALHATNPDGLLYNNTIPTDPTEVLFAKPTDPNNLDAGWTSLEPEDQEDLEELFQEEEEEEVRGKTKIKANGKAKATTTTTKAQDKDWRQTPQGAGLRENAVVAFRFRAGRPVPRDDLVGLGVDEGFEDEEDNVSATAAATAGAGDWDVVLPKFEDVYGIGDLVPDDEMVTPKPTRVADFGPV